MLNIAFAAPAGVFFTDAKFLHKHTCSTISQLIRVYAAFFFFFYGKGRAKRNFSFSYKYKSELKLKAGEIFILFS